MKLKRGASLLLVAGIIIMGACSCMNHQGYNQEIIKKLEAKYDKSFEMVTLSYAVDGENGSYYRAVCKEQGCDNTFVAYYYLNGSDYLLSEELGEQPGEKSEPRLVDTYVNLQLNLKVADQLVSDNSELLLAIADVAAFDYALTLADVDMGVEHCLANDGFNVQAKLCLFANSSIEDREKFENAIMQKLLDMKVYKLLVDVAYIQQSDLEGIKNDYYDDIYRIDSRLEEDQRVERYVWFFARGEQGIIEHKVVKGV